MAHFLLILVRAARYLAIRTIKVQKLQGDEGWKH
jgi:hypothetical protein